MSADQGRPWPTLPDPDGDPRRWIVIVDGRKSGGR